MEVCVVDQLSEMSLWESRHRESLLESVTREELIKAGSILPGSEVFIVSLGK